MVSDRTEKQPHTHICRDGGTWVKQLAAYLHWKKGSQWGRAIIVGREDTSRSRLNRDRGAESSAEKANEKRLLGRRGGDLREGEREGGLGGIILRRLCGDGHPFTHGVRTRIYGVESVCGDKNASVVGCHVVVAKQFQRVPE
eukprot:GGOE01058863.1.p2 GENE.GGOE01058863.1~~GGOE01058863.1.p2  ORF type:complete len:142 (+),score=1.18 GGOE01058863.1:1050-1475(+)